METKVQNVHEFYAAINFFMWIYDEIQWPEFRALGHDREQWQMVVNARQCEKPQNYMGCFLEIVGGEYNLGIIYQYWSDKVAMQMDGE